jgi:hypothetical protein
MSDFIKPKKLKDVLSLIFKNKHLQPEEIFNLIITDNHIKNNSSRRGFLYEAIVRLCIIAKCFDYLHYTFFEHGKTTNFNHLKDIRELLEENLHKGHDSGSDIIIQQNDIHIFITVKYRDTKYDITDLVSMFSQKKDFSVNEMKYCVIVKDTINIPNTHDKDSNEYKLMEQVKENKLLFSEKNVINALAKLLYQIKHIDSIEDFEELINKDYLNNPRKLLILRLHQKIFLDRFINLYSKNKNLTICLKNKPRSGKTILMLCIAKYLLGNDCKKIIIVTPIVSTLKDFIENLNEFLDFKNITCYTRDSFDNLNENFNGIFLCSSQFLKNDLNKEKLKHFKNINFDAYIGDEYHLGGTTLKTQKICNRIPIKIFASGTPDKVIEYFNLQQENVFTWEQNDEIAVKNYNNGDENAITWLKNKHPELEKCLEDKTLNSDYSDTPVQCYIKHSLSSLLGNIIDDYNIKNNTNYGYDLKSLFALEIDKDGNYLNKFKICRTEAGKELLIQVLETIISTDPNNKETLMSNIEKTQHDYNSRKSCKEHPLLFLIYLPTHTNNNNIALLQKTLLEFIKNNKLWVKFYISYSNGTCNSLNSKDYNTFIEEALKKTKEDKKKGCIVWLGDQGGVGVTYHECDVTISMDDSHNLDTKIQRDSRALTPAHNKTIGINCDMNSHRYLLTIYRMIQDYKKFYKSNEPDHIILKKMYDEKIFICDPHMFSRFSSHDAIKYYEEICKNLTEIIDVEKLLNQIQCNRFFSIKFKETKIRHVNDEIQGDNIDLRKAGKDEISNDTVIKKTKESEKEDDEEKEEDDEEKEEDDKEEEEDDEDQENNKQICECFKIILPILALLSRTYKNKSFKEILQYEKKLIDIILSKKSIYGNEIYNMIDYMIDYNDDIVDRIRTLYEISPPEKIRAVVAKHFIPSTEEKQNFAEIPTPINLVNDMINIIDKNFWKTTPKILEPCCGKGNFILALFDILYEYLENIYKSPYETCKVIIEECLYYIDISPLNVFITTELLKCHVQSYCGLEYVDFEFNKRIGDSLTMELNEKFDLIIGNPPYQNSCGNKGKGNTLWDKFVDKSLNEWIIKKGLLSFVHPNAWRQIDNNIGKLMLSKQIIYLNMNDVCKGQRVFNCSTTFDYYVLQNIESYTETLINDYKNREYKYSLKNKQFIPNHSINEINEYLDFNNENGLIKDRSTYGTDKKWMSKIKTDEHKYPCVYSINKNNDISLRYSNTNTKGHFGVCKYIVSNGCGRIRDINGEYGCTEWSYYIKCQPENMDDIEKCFSNNKFLNLNDALKLTSNKYNYSILKYLKKDFWKEFI